MYEKLEESARRFRQERKERLEKPTELKERLKRSISTKMRTAFIGALSQFEQFFGTIWGHNKPEEILTINQLEMKKRWEQVRNNILNNGNNQLRAAEAELETYDIRVKNELRNL